MSSIFSFLTLLAIAALIAYFSMYVPRHVLFVITPKNLRLQGDPLYGRTVARGTLLADQAKVVNDGSGETISVQLRTNGVGLPNYQSGWFRTSLGKALLFRRPGVAMVTIPTTDGYTLILTPQQPQQFLHALRMPGSSFQTGMAQ